MAIDFLGPDPDRTVAADSPSGPPVGQPLPLGHRLQEYVIEGLVGEGGFGIVYLARDTQLGRVVAMKEYMPASLARRGAGATVTLRSEAQRETFELGLRSFVNEARLLAAFDQPSLVKVYRFWEQNGTAYMVMPYYQGPTLRQWLVAHEAPAEAWLRQLLAPLLDALELMHANRCYHRDIAPDNILLVQPSTTTFSSQAEVVPVLLDFGAARRVISDATQALTVFLKPGYAPIEQYAESTTIRQGPWTDVYALCAVLYAAITGHAPPPSVSRIVEDEIVPAAEAGAGRYSPGFLSMVDAGLAVRPEHRPRDIASLRQLLAEAAPAGEGRGWLLGGVKRSVATKSGHKAARTGDPALASAPPAGARPTAATGALHDPVHPPASPFQESASFAATTSPPPEPPGSLAPIAGTPPPGAAMSGVAEVESPWAADPGAHAPVLPGRAHAPGDVLRTFGPGTDAGSDKGSDEGSRRSMRGPTPWIAGAAALIVAGVAVWWTISRGPAPAAPSDASPSAASAASAVAPTWERASAVARIDPPALPAAPPATPFTVVGALDEIVRQADPLFSVNALTDKSRLRIGRDRLQFRIRSKEAGHVYVFLSGTDKRHFYLLFPNEIDRDNRIAANAELSLPRKSWAITAGGPPGTNHIVTVVSRQPLDLSDVGLSAASEEIPEFDLAQAEARWDARSAGRSPFLGRVLCESTGPCDRGYGASLLEVEEVAP